MTEQQATPGETPVAANVPLRQVAAVFLRLGFTAFGGPAAHIALMEEEVVRRRAWLTHAAFLDLLGATNLIPGPNATDVIKATVVLVSVCVMTYWPRHRELSARRADWDAQEHNGRRVDRCDGVHPPLAGRKHRPSRTRSGLRFRGSVDAGSDPAVN